MDLYALGVVLTEAATGQPDGDLSGPEQRAGLLRRLTHPAASHRPPSAAALLMLLRGILPAGETASWPDWADCALPAPAGIRSRSRRGPSWPHERPS